MSEHEPTTDAPDESQRMTPEEVEETRHAPTSQPDSYPGGDYDAEMTDDIEPESWDNDWRPSDEAENRG